MSADKEPTHPSVWVLTDGKIGDDVQCLAIAGTLNPAFEKKVIAPRPPWEWLAPWGPVDPKDDPSRAGSIIAAPFPDVVVVSGRRAIPYGRAVKKASGGNTFLTIMKDPRVGAAAADLVWAPAHDQLSGENVMTTLTSPHGLASVIDTARRDPKTPVAQLPRSMLGVILGGPSGGARFDAQAASELSVKINLARNVFASVAISPSRRTPDAFLDLIAKNVTGKNVYVWDRQGTNPYVEILANADALIVTADSHNMMSEAVSTGAGVYAWRPKGLAKKLNWFVGELEKLGAVRRFEGSAAPFSHEPIDATVEIVARIKLALAESQAPSP